MYKLFSALMIHRIPSEEELAASEGRAQRSGCMVRLPVKKPIPAMMMVVKWYHCVLALSSAPSTSNAPLVPIAMSLSLNVPSLWNHTKSALSRILLHLENPHSQTPFFTTKMQRPFCFFEPKFLQAFCTGSRRCASCTYFLVLCYSLVNSPCYPHIAHE